MLYTLRYTHTDQLEQTINDISALSHASNMCIVDDSHWEVNSWGNVYVQ